ncbi:hypothetical protein FZC84_02835 [Rossellomorea vietnamensis]|uniref:Uncharacterized protein n=1 Tax=Rossellomorea vietnamensis TaxID=218284 RepID=A0A5D4MJ26_9BACI|nr:MULTISPECIES: hypothetical protein [Bacillaceae]TYS01598.1 hypothetical protein FZC84_02835 [Rossellomorea vietnamensis]
MEPNYEELLSLYKKIWKSRELKSAEEDSAAILQQAIIRELKDENSHPRVRVDKETKYYFAIKRITESNLAIDEKYKLIDYYTLIAGELRSYQ